MTDRRAIELADDMAFQERSWRVQRVGWVVMGLLLLAALAGLFAGGPLSWAEAGDAEALRVEYGRFERYEAPTELRLRLGPAAVEGGRVTILLDGDYADKVPIEHIEPRPERAASSAAGHLLVFAVGEDGRPGTVTLSVRPDRIGLVRGRIAVAGRPPVEFPAVGLALMETVLRAAAVYLALLLIFRIAGRRTVAAMTTFDFVLVLVIAEATQNALVGEDFSVTNAVLTILSLVGLDIAFSLLKRRFPFFGKIVDGVPTIIVENGRPLRDRLARARLSEDDVLEAARRVQGLERMEQIRYAVLEVSGGISIVPK